jgi:hypothetical protein
LGDRENKDKKEKIIRRIRDNGKRTSKTHRSSTPFLQYSNTPILHYSIASTLHFTMGRLENWNG